MSPCQSKKDWFKEVFCPASLFENRNFYFYFMNDINVRCLSTSGISVFGLTVKRFVVNSLLGERDPAFIVVIIKFASKQIRWKYSEKRNSFIMRMEDQFLVILYTWSEISLYFQRARTINVGCRYNAA